VSKPGRISIFRGWPCDTLLLGSMLVPRLFELNGMDLNAIPIVESDLEQRVDLAVLWNFVLRLSQAGMPRFPNEELQTFLLDAGGSLKVSDPRALQRRAYSMKALSTRRQGSAVAAIRDRVFGITRKKRKHNGVTGHV
jgi:hypothetical protein